MGFTLIGGSGGTTNVPTQSTRTYDTTGANFGLNTPAVDLTSGTANAIGTPGTLGTLSADVDGLDITFTTLTNTAGGLLIIYANGSPIITWPVNPANMFGLPQLHSIPVKALSGVALSAGWAALASGQNCHVAVAPYQSSVPETITSWTCLGNTTGNLNAQGVSLTTAGSWGQVGVLGAGGAKALAVQALTSVTSRTGSNTYVVDIGTGASGSETLLIPAIAPRPRDTTTALNHAGSGVKRIVLAGSTRVAAKAQTEAGTLPNGINVQVAVGA